MFLLVLRVLGSACTRRRAAKQASSPFHIDWMAAGAGQIGMSAMPGRHGRPLHPDLEEAQAQVDLVPVATIGLVSV